MKQASAGSEEIVTFLRKRDYRMVRELGQGACGKTVLLYDEQIEERFVCKKYVPYDEAHRQELYKAFVREVKLLHQLLHPNVVRVFNYYLYPEQLTGYILMEHVDGLDLDDHVAKRPEQTNDLFLEAVAGFAYLERTGILHRDIRPGNLMVRADGILKIIDLGFGKKIERSSDFDKSITLNWWCDPPAEFGTSRYDFRTEVYFVGKLFQWIIQENNIEHFKYMDTLAAMCQRSPSARIGGFAEIEKTVRSEQFPEVDFDDGEISAYRRFSDALCRHVTKVRGGAKYAVDVNKVRTALNEVYQRFMLEETVPDSAVVLRCFLMGKYFYRKAGLEVAVVRDFLKLLQATTDERAGIILANLHTKLDALPRFLEPTDDDIPF